VQLPEILPNVLLLLFHVNDVCSFAYLKYNINITNLPEDLGEPYRAIQRLIDENVKKQFDALNAGKGTIHQLIEVSDE